MRDHRKLRAFELADRLALQADELTRSFPRDELFGLTSQLRRSAVSIPSNVFECRRRVRSARELEYQISLARRFGYGNPAEVATVQDESVETSKVLNGLIRSLRAEQELPRTQSQSASGNSSLPPYRLGALIQRDRPCQRLQDALNDVVVDHLAA